MVTVHILTCCFVTSSTATGWRLEEFLPVTLLGQPANWGELMPPAWALDQMKFELSLVLKGWGSQGQRKGLGATVPMDWESCCSVHKVAQSAGVQVGNVP